MNIYGYYKYGYGFNDTDIYSLVLPLYKLLRKCMFRCQKTLGCTHVDIAIFTNSGKCSLKGGKVSQTSATPSKNHFAGIIVVNPLITNLYYNYNSVTTVNTVTKLTTIANKQASYFSCCFELAAPDYFHVYSDVKTETSVSAAGSSFEANFKKCISKCDINSYCFYLSYNCKTGKCDLWNSLIKSHVLFPNYGTVVAVYASRDKFSTFSSLTTATKIKNLFTTDIITYLTTPLNKTNIALTTEKTSKRPQNKAIGLEFAKSINLSTINIITSINSSTLLTTTPNIYSTGINIFTTPIIITSITTTSLIATSISIQLTSNAISPDYTKSINIYTTHVIITSIKSTSLITTTISIQLITNSMSLDCTTDISVSTAPVIITSITTTTLITTSNEISIDFTTDTIIVTTPATIISTLIVKTSNNYYTSDINARTTLINESNHQASDFPCCNNIAVPYYFYVYSDVNYLTVGFSVGSSFEQKFQKCVSKCDVSSFCFYLSYNCETGKCDLWKNLSNSNHLLPRNGTVVAMYGSHDRFSKSTAPPTITTSKRPSVFINGCFSLKNSVRMADSTEKSLKNLRIGDFVISITDSSGNIGTTEVIAIMEYKIRLNKFIEIRTESGHSLTLTMSHLIFEKNKGYMRAEHVKLKDELEVFIGNNGTSKFSKVILINEIIENGLIAPLTKSGNLIVNGIHASCYAGVSSHSFAHLFLKPIVYWYNLNRYFQFEKTETESNLFQLDNFLHPYIAFLKFSGIKDLIDLVYTTLF